MANDRALLCDNCNRCFHMKCLKIKKEPKVGLRKWIKIRVIGIAKIAAGCVGGLFLANFFCSFSFMFVFILIQCSIFLTQNTWVIATDFVWTHKTLLRTFYDKNKRFLKYVLLVITHIFIHNRVMGHIKQNCSYLSAHTPLKKSYFYLMDKGTLTQELVEKKDSIREEKRHLRTYSFGPWLSCINMYCN